MNHEPLITHVEDPRGTSLMQTSEYPQGVSAAAATQDSVFSISVH